MKYKGYELLKAIADGEIKKNQNIRIKFKDNSGEIFVFDGTETIDITHKNIFDIYGTLTVLKSDFELIEDEIDIDSIEKLSKIAYTEIDLNKKRSKKDVEFTDKEIILAEKINQLIKAVKQLIKAVKQLNKEVKKLKNRK